MKRTLPLVLTLVFLFFFHSISMAGLKGLPEGKPRVEIGDTAPMEHPKLIKARETGKAIILMSTHHLTYPLKVADRILMLDQGALIGDEDPRNFKLDFLEEHRDREPMGL